MHNYYYDIVCMQTMILFLWWGFVMSVTLSYAWIMLIFSLIHHRRTTKTCSVFLPLSSVYRSNWPVTGPYRAVYRSKPNELAFQFGIWICRFSAVTAAYRPVYRNRRPAARRTGSVSWTLLCSAGSRSGVKINWCQDGNGDSDRIDSSQKWKLQQTCQRFKAMTSGFFKNRCTASREGENW
jgi:hypothetical protein